MKECKECKEIKECVYGSRLCRECRNKIGRLKVLEKSKKICPICQFKHVRVAKECGLKCMILNRHKKIHECWEWQGKVAKNGYGNLTYGFEGKKYHLLAHRVSYEIFKGEIPEKKCVCHSCDNRKCVNPDHLWIGNHKENIQDAKKKCRLKKTTGYKHTKETKEKFKLRKPHDKRGVKHHLCKLTQDDVLEIRRLMKTKIKRKEIVKIFGIKRNYLYDIASYKTWPHLT